MDEHVDAVNDDAEAARRHALRIKDSLLTRSTEPVAALSGPVLAAAIGQVLTATTADPDIAVLGGVRFDAGPDGLTVTATDRYRLATRTMVPSSSRPTTWAATVDGTDLRNALADLRRSPRVEIDATENEMWLRLSDRGDRSCRLLAEPFPDHRAMLEALPPVTTRVQIPTTAFLRARAPGRGSDRARRRTVHDDTSGPVFGQRSPDTGDRTGTIARSLVRDDHAVSRHHLRDRRRCARRLPPSRSAGHHPLRGPW
ncbi:hypothetical protein [Gordonia rubripertincta]|uniref:DNA polymerase III subunit beta family protein n=1 Tax=Gordonia rubripertincta TaxID=36822 RepID=UPI0020C3D6B2|nr:hypothetical protein [Gordonia rubripertincta]